MAESISELVVKVTPEGVRETNQQLDSQQQKFEETTDVVQEQSDALDGMSQRLTGAATAILGGLTVLTAGLLSKIPVLGQAMNGLDAILTSLGLAVDTVLRPALDPLTTLFFQISNAINQTEGPLKSIIGILTIVATVAAAIGAAMVAGIISPSALVVGAILGIVAAGATLLSAWSDNWFGIRDITQRIIGIIEDRINTFIEFLKGIWEGLKDIWHGDWGDLWEGILDFGKDAVKGFIDLMSLFIGSGIKLFTRFVTTSLNIYDKFWNRVRAGFKVTFDLIVMAIKEAFNLVNSTVNDIVNAVIDAVNSAIGAVEDFINIAAEKANEIPGLDIGKANFDRLDNINIAEDTETRSPKQIWEDAMNQQGVADKMADKRQRERDQAVNEQIQSLVDAMKRQAINFEVNLDSQQVASQTESWMDRSTTNNGRGAER